MVCYKSSCISSGYTVTPFYFASRITPYMLSISWIVIPTSPHSHFGLSEMRIKSVTVHPNSSLGAQEPKNAMNSCLLHPIHHFSEVLWHFSHSNMFYTMKSVLASNADVHILSTIYEHVRRESISTSIRKVSIPPWVAKSCLTCLLLSSVIPILAWELVREMTFYHYLCQTLTHPQLKVEL